MQKIAQALSLLALIVAASFWISEVKSDTDNNTQEIVLLRQQRDRVEAKLDEISERLSKIEGKLEANNRLLLRSQNGQH